MKLKVSPKILVNITVLLTLLCSASAVMQGQTLTTLHSFQSGTSDGQSPYGGLLRDSSGNLYGTTEFGGTGSCTITSGNGCGTVFKLAPSSGSYNLLHSFAGGSGDGSYPFAGNLILDGAGDLYGTTSSGGSSSDGTIFELVNSTSCSNDFCESLLYSFAGPTADGAGPNGSLFNSSGNLYGTTASGGANSTYGAVFELPSGSSHDTLLYSFAGSTADGATPNGSLIADSSGNLYGTTQGGGASSMGSVFEVSGSSDTLLYSFSGGNDGATPYAGLIKDSSGNLYGTTAFGGGTPNAGIVFELSPPGISSCPSGGNWCETILYTFAGGTSDGGVPYGGLVIDSSDNLYGTTWQGGTNNAGTIFELVYSSGTYTEKVLYSFTGGNDGKYPYAGLVTDGSGDFFGTTTQGGTSGYGTVFELSPGCPNFPSYSPDFSANENCLTPNGSSAGYPSFQSPAPPPASGVPANVSKVLRLTPNRTFWAGSAWYENPQPVGGNWSTTFSFQLSDTNASDGNADGIAFVIQNSGPTALGDDGCGMGYAEGSCISATGGIPNSLAIAFKTYNDGYPNPNNNSVLITSAGTGANCIDQSCSIAYNNNLPNSITLANNGVHTATITYALQPTSTQTACAPNNVPGPCLDVIVDGTDLFPAGVPVNISTLLNLNADSANGNNAGYALVGFTGGTGGGDDDQDILDWLFTVGQTQTATVTPTQPATFNFNGGFTEGSPNSGYSVNAQETTTTQTVQMVITPISMPQGECNTIVRASFPTAECFVYLNAGGPGVDESVMLAITCGNGGSCGSNVNPFDANISEDFVFNCGENSPLMCPTFEPDGMTFITAGSFGLPNITSSNHLPEIGGLKGTGPDPNNPCTTYPGNSPALFQSNQIISENVVDTGSKPTKQGSGGTTSCWVETYMTEDSEIPSVTVTQPVNGGTYQLNESNCVNGVGPDCAQYACSSVFNGVQTPQNTTPYPAMGATGPYLTVNNCTATDTPPPGGATVANGAQFDTSTAGLHTFVAYVQDSAYNTNQTTVTYDVEGPQAPLVVTGPSSVTYGTPGTATASGGSGTGALTFSSGSSTGCSVNGTAVTVITVSGTCSITAMKAADNYYDATTSLPFPVTLVPASQTITFTQNAPASAAYNSTFGVAATASSGLAVAITTSGSCSGSGTSSATITMTNSTGTCSVIANQAGSTNYSAAPQVTQTVNATGPLLSLSCIILPGGKLGNCQPSVNFGTANLDLALDPAIVMVSNTGTATVNFSSISLTLGPGTNKGDFTLIDNYPYPPFNLCSSKGTLAAGKTCYLAVLFFPGNIGTLSATLNIADNAPPSAPVNFAATVINPQVKFTPASLSFPTTTHGTGSSTLPVTLSNPGTTPLLINSIGITGASAFTQTSNCPIGGSLAANGGACIINVTFKPGAVGTFTANLTVNSNALPSTQSAPLSGKGK